MKKKPEKKKGLSPLLFASFQSSLLNNSHIANKQKLILIMWPFKEIQIHLHPSLYVNFQRGARKFRDILLPYKKAMDDEDKKKWSLTNALKHSLYNSDELLQLHVCNQLAL